MLLQLPTVTLKGHVFQDGNNICIDPTYLTKLRAKDIQDLRCFFNSESDLQAVAFHKCFEEPNRTGPENWNVDPVLALDDCGRRCDVSFTVYLIIWYNFNLVQFQRAAM